MGIKDMHYDFKKKLNKIDSQQYRNLLVPEIDWALNEAESMFIDLISNPRRAAQLGFETSQKTTDDIYPLVVPTKKLDLNNSVADLPKDYRYFIKAHSFISKCNCKNQRATIYPKRHGEEFYGNPFYDSSFEWRYVNAHFIDKGIKVYDDGTFTIDEVYLTYIRNPKPMHNAEDFPGGKYKTPSGVILSGFSNSELPEHTHREIVDLAVMITTGEINPAELSIKAEKVNLNGLLSR